MKNNRGMTQGAALMVLLGLTAVVSLGFSFRETELKFSDRGRCRAAARWAAESAIERGRAQLERRGVPGRVVGTLGEGVAYGLVTTPNGAGYEFVGTGTCEADGRTITQRAHARVDRTGGRWALSSYRLLAGAPDGRQ